MPDFLALGGRIKECIRKIGNYDKAAQKTGIPKRTLTNYGMGINDIKSEALIAIARAADVPIEWLATGQEPDTAPHQPASTVTLIPVMNVRASAGGGSVILDERQEGFLSFSKIWLEKQGLISNSLFTLPAVGDSMEPTIRTGDFVVCSGAEHHLKADDGIYIIRYDENVLVKRLQYKPGRVKVISDNQAYEAYEIPLNDGTDFRVLGKVVLITTARRV